LKSIETFPDYTNILDAAKSAGVRLVPIDVETDPTNHDMTSENRESTLANNMLSLYAEDPSTPIVAWIGDLHAARNSLLGVPSLADRIANSPDFASGKAKLSTVYSEISEKESSSHPLHTLSKKVTEPVAVPVKVEGVDSPMTQLPVLSEIGAEGLKSDLRLGDYDHVVLYPPTPLRKMGDYYLARAQRLMESISPDDMQFSALDDVDPVALRLHDIQGYSPFRDSQSYSPFYDFPDVDSIMREFMASRYPRDLPKKDWTTSPKNDPSQAEQFRLKSKQPTNLKPPKNFNRH